MEYLKHLLIRTPLQQPLEKINFQLELRKSRKVPELSEIYLEPLRIEQVLERIIQPSFNCIDIGAHLGSTLVKILKLSPNGNHIAVEAIPYKAQWLQKKFPEVSIKCVVLNNTEREITFYIDNKKTGFSGIFASPNQLATSDLQEITLTSKTLDNILDSDYRVDFMKIDVEGAEFNILQGAEKTLDRFQPTLLFECAQGGLKKSGTTSEEIYKLLTEKHQYAVFMLKDFLNNGLPLSYQDFDKALTYPFQANNFIAIHPNKQTKQK